MNPFRPECLPTAVGSLPHPTADAAVDCILRNLPDIPFWPQLPMLGYREGMCPMYSEGIPAAHVDAEQEKIWVETETDLLVEMERFYERYMAEDLDLFAVSAEYAAGLPVFLDRVAALETKPRFIKGHITGPITWGLTVTDRNKKASFYNEQLRDGIVKALARKAAWQARLLARFGSPVVMFIDEPYLQSVGSSFVSLQPDDVIGALDEIIDALHAENAIVGLHCCGNTDWGLLSRAKIDIINFDAYGFPESISLYPKEIGGFIERGGSIAWGIVPAAPILMDETPDTLVARFNHALKMLESEHAGRERLLESSLITPSCGGGSLTVEQAERMLELTREVSNILRGTK